jgi:F-box domain
MHINDIPIEVLRLIFLKLEPTSYFYASQVCKKWRSTCREKQTLSDHISEWFGGRQDLEHCMRLVQATEAPWKIPDANSYSNSEKSVYLPIIKQQGLFEYFFPTHKILFTKDIGNCNSSFCKATDFVVSQDGTKILHVAVSKRSDHTIRLDLYDVSGKDPVKRWSTSRHLGYEPVDTYLSSGGDYIATSYLSGYVEVIRLLPGGTLKRVFFKQFPSDVLYLAVSKNGQVMFCRFTRLGGLILINLQTGEELDIGHYRMDLKMQLQFHDKVLALPGYSETVMFGGGKQQLPNHTDIDPDVDLWDYYKQLTQQNQSVYVPLERAVALGVPNWYLGFAGTHLRLWKRDEEAEEEDEKEVQEEVERALGTNSSRNDHEHSSIQLSTQDIRNEPRAGELDDNDNDDNEDHDDTWDQNEHEREDAAYLDEDGMTVPCYTFGYSHNSWIPYDISSSADQMVIPNDDGKLILVRLTAKTIEESVKLGILPVREIPIHGIIDNLQQVRILSNNRIVLVTTFCLIICKLSETIEPCKHLLLHEESGLRPIVTGDEVNTVSM